MAANEIIELFYELIVTWLPIIAKQKYEIMECNSSDAEMSHFAEGSESTIQAKIKTLDSQTYNLHVNKYASLLCSQLLLNRSMSAHALKLVKRCRRYNVSKQGGRDHAARRPYHWRFRREPAPPPCLLPVGDAHAGIQRQHLGLLPVNPTSPTMQPPSEGGGTDATVHAMFWLIPQGSSPTSKGQHTTNGTAAMTTPTSVLIELFDLPGMDKVIRASDFDVPFALFDKKSSVAT
ncbi:hypothetical protein TRIUR3_08480 [Triticum urartu]|uniref:Uncharacterized protein n=1 Tax=Triticum urartu TaxID=4572 RepID=M7YWA9_TRIUA|nr:hypothetical protein TRIUR3_08480 [Triticum urartu]